jgi:NAD(P)-dependent dehydrogenase (short-subunit alcohol dehydrogenase family)
VHKGCENVDRKFPLGNFVAGGMGNGRAAAILLARQGAKVALLDHIIEQAQETKRMIDEEGGISEVIHCDATVEADCKNAVKKTVELFGAVHILVNVGTPVVKYVAVHFADLNSSRNWRRERNCS